MNATRESLAADVVKTTGVLPHEAKTVLRVMLDLIAEVTIEEGRTVELRGFGTFAPRIKNRRLARNPRTGEPVWIPKRMVLTWKASPDLKIGDSRAR